MRTVLRMCTILLAAGLGWQAAPAEDLTGWLAERGFDRRYVTSVVAMACGLGLIFTAGIVWLAFFARSAVGLETALRTGLYPFIPADIFKIFLAAAVMPTAWRLVGRQHPDRSNRRK